MLLVRISVGVSFSIRTLVENIGSMLAAGQAPVMMAPLVAALA